MLEVSANPELPCSSESARSKLPASTCCSAFHRCDDGGNLLLCDGTCMRGFHVQTEEEGSCNSISMPADLFDRVQVPATGSS